MAKVTALKSHRPRTTSSWSCYLVAARPLLALHVVLFALVIHGASAPICTLSAKTVNSSQHISIFATFMTDFNSTRIPDLRDYIESAVKPDGLDFEYWFINWTRHNDTRLRSLYPPDEYRAAMKTNRRPKRFRKDLDLSGKFFFCLRLFLSNSTAGWFYRATDDTIINFANLVPFMRWVESRYDPYTQPVVLGNCIDVKRFSYLQGGSGILFSRRAAQKLERYRDMFMKKLNRAEDVFLAKVMALMNVSLTTATCEYFIGHDIYTEHRAMIWNRTLHLLPKCPDVRKIWKRSCRPFVSPVRDLVFWHQEGGNKTLGSTIEFSKMVTSLPRNIMWWLNWGRPHLCQSLKVPPRRF